MHDYRGNILMRLAKNKALGMICLAVMFFAALPVRAVYAGPDVSAVVHGEVSFEQSGNDTTIHAGDNAIIEYNNFDIAHDESVTFVQPDAASRVLNRVLSDNPSMIYGRLSANGIVYLTNRAGIIVGSDAVVDAGAFYAAAGEISNDDFLSRLDRFTDLDGHIMNEGHIKADAIYLLAEKIENSGTIQSNDGTIAMLVGDDIVIGHPLDDFAIRIEGAASNHENEGIIQAGNIDAGQGKVMFGAGDMASLAIHHTGATRARQVSIDAGKTGHAVIEGEIDTRNRAPENQGGTITVAANKIEIENAVLDASGEDGGGTIEIGGGLRGQGARFNAERVSVDQNSIIRADAIQNGDGGTIILWSDIRTEFRGTLLARGGTLSGDGGFAEISGKSLMARGHVDLSAAHGDTGTLLYDPVNIRIVGGAADGDDNPDAANNNLQGDGGTNGLIDITDTGTGADPFIIYESEIENTNANIILEAEENITVSGDFGGDTLLILPDNDLVLRIRNDGNAGIIDLTTADEGRSLLVRTQGTGSILLDASTSGLNAGDIRTGLLRSDQGDIDLRTGNGTIYLANDIQTDGGDVMISGATILENSVTIDTELGNNSAAGNVDFSGAVISRVNISNVGEAGTFLSPSNAGWFTINFARAYVNPVIVATTNTHNGQSALVPEVRNVTPTSAEIRLCESEGSSGAGCDTHAPETVGYLVFDASESAAIDGIEAGSFSIGGQSDTTTTTINFAESFTSTPVVLALVTSDNGANRPVEARVVSRNINSFTAGICFQNSLDGCDGAHPNETVHWIAIDPSNLPFAQQNEAGSTGDTVSNSDWTLQNFATPFAAPPVVIVETQTDDGTEDNEIDEARNVTSTSVEVRYCEMQSGDSCDSHTSEEVAWYAVEAGLLGTAGGTLNINTTGATNGNVDLGSFDNAGGAYLLGLSVDSGTAPITLHGNISLDSVTGAALSFNGTGNIVLSDNVTIDTEVGGDDPSVNIDFSGRPISADASGFALDLDTRGSTNGTITLGLFDNGGGAYLQGLRLQNDTANVTLNNDITLDNGGGATEFIVSGSGQIILNDDLTIDMEHNDDAAAGTLDISQYAVTTFARFESGETGTFTAPTNGGWFTLNFSRTYTTPVVVATTNTANGNNARVAEVRNVTPTSAEIRICESDGHVAAGCQVHPNETVGYLVFDAADNAAISGIEAGTFNENGNFDSSNTTVNFVESFTTAPLVFVNVQTVTGANFPVEARVTNVNTNSFTSGICFQNSTDGCLNSKGFETVGWVAIDPNNIPFPVSAEGGTVSIGNSAWTNVNFTETYTQTPVVIVEVQTQNGAQDIEIDEARDITTAGAEIRYCELDGPNNCDTHNAETVAWFASEPFSAEPNPILRIDGAGGSGAEIRLGVFDNSGGGYIGGLNITTGGGDVRLLGDIDLETGASPADMVISGGGNIFIDSNRTIDVEQGGDNAAGRIDFGTSIVSGTATGLDLLLDASGGTNTGGNIRLGGFGNAGGHYVNDVDARVNGATNGILQLGGDIRLDNNGVDTGDLTFNGDFAEIMAATVIDTEQGDDGNGGAVNLNNALIYADAAGFDVTIDTGTVLGGGTSGAVNIGSFSDNSGADFFVNDLTLSSLGDTRTAFSIGDILLDGNSVDTAALTLRGDIQINVDSTWDTEQGGDEAGGAADLSDTDISAAVAGRTLSIDTRGTNDANLTFSTATNAGGQFINTLSLAGGAITQSGAIDVSSLRLLGTGDVSLTNTANNIDTLASISTGRLEYFDADGFTVGSVFGTNGINAGGAVDLTAGGNDSLLDIQQTITATSESAFIADKMNIAAAVNVGTNALNLLPENIADSSDDINLGAAGDASANTLELSDSELDQITASIIRIGDANADEIRILNAISPASANTLSLRGNGAISQLAGANITVADLLFRTSSNAILDALNDIDNLAAQITGNFHFNDVDDLNISSVDTISGITADGDIYLQTGTSLSQDPAVLLSADGLALNAGTTAILNEDNNVLRLAATQSTDLQFNTVGDLSIDTVFGLNGILAGVVDAIILSGGTITLNQSANVANNITMAAGDDFINNAGAAALSAGGYYRIYSTDPARNNQGGIIPDYEEYLKPYPELPAITNLALSGFLYEVAEPVENIGGAFYERRLPEGRDFFDLNPDLLDSYCPPGAKWVDHEICEPYEDYAE